MSKVEVAILWYVMCTNTLVLVVLILMATSMPTHCKQVALQPENGHYYVNGCV